MGGKCSRHDAPQRRPPGTRQRPVHMVRARGRRAGSSDQDIERGHGCGVVGSSEREVGTKAGDWRNVLSYQDFLERKSQLGSMDGFEPVWLPDFLFDFQRALVEWNIAKGRSATFA